MNSPPFAEKKFATINGTRMAYLDEGDGDPIVFQYGNWLATSPVPKLFVNADPGSILTGRQREFCRTWPNQAEVTVPGRHFIQEDSPHLIGTAVADFVRRLRDDRPSR
jgi:haloalkane dehalogenase